jgi:hypothetical protein
MGCVQQPILALLIPEQQSVDVLLLDDGISFLFTRSVTWFSYQEDEQGVKRIQAGGRGT